MRKIDLLVVHCADTPAGMDIGADKIRDWHVNGNGWSDIGYNYVIKRDGTVEPGRDLDGDGDVDEEVGAHAKGFNANSLGICLIGGKGADGKVDANFTASQYAALTGLVADLLDKYPQATVCGHRDLRGSDKPCPGFDVKAFFGV